MEKKEFLERTKIQRELKHLEVYSPTFSSRANIVGITRNGNYYVAYRNDDNANPTIITQSTNREDCYDAVVEYFEIKKTFKDRLVTYRDKLVAHLTSTKRTKLSSHFVPDNKERAYRICYYAYDTKEFGQKEQHCIKKIGPFKKLEGVSEVDMLKVISYFVGIVSNGYYHFEEPMLYVLEEGLKNNGLEEVSSEEYCDYQIVDLPIVEYNKKKYKLSHDYSRHIDWYVPNVDDSEYYRIRGMEEPKTDYVEYKLK